MGIKKDSPIGKKIILVKKYSIRSIGRKTEIVCRSLYQSNTGSQNFGHSKRIQSSISFKTFSVKNPFPTNSEPRRRRIVGTGGKKNVKEGSHQKSSTIKMGVCKQHIPCKKEGLGPKTSDKFEATECMYPILSLQNGRFAKPEIHVARRRLHVQSSKVDVHVQSRRRFQFPWKKNQGNLFASVGQEACTSSFAFTLV